MKKRFLAMLLALVMCLALLPTAALATEEFEINDKGVLTKYNGPGGTVIIPEGVKRIEDAFYKCTTLTDVKLPSTLKELGWSAFSECTSITSIVIPEGVTRIGQRAFKNCTNLASVTIPASVVDIEDYAFDNCNNIKDVYYGGTKEQWQDWHFALGIYNSVITKRPGKEDANGNLVVSYDDGLSVTIHFGVSEETTPDQPDILDPTKGVGATPTDNSLTVDGKAVEPAAYKIGGANYFMLRDVAMLLNGSPKQFAVDWDGATESAVITSGQAYVPQGYELRGRPTANATANLSTDVIYFGGKKAELTIYKIGDNNYIKLRDLGILLDFYVGYDDATKSAFIDTNRPYDHNS